MPAASIRGKRQRNGFSPRVPRREHSPGDILILAGKTHVELLTQRIIKQYLCCLKSSNLRLFVMVAKGNQYRVRRLGTHCQATA